MISKAQTQTLPQKPGVYMFQNSNGKVVYIGKSINIKERVKSHILAKGDKSQNIVQEGKSVKYIVTESELEALLLEAKLIKKYLPKYNLAARDDKHPLYIKITKETFPKILMVRREQEKGAKYFGPFPSSTSVKNVLKQIRRIFPYCTQKACLPARQARLKKGCFYFHIGLCNPCPWDIQNVKNTNEYIKLKKHYTKNLKRVALLLSGKTKVLQKILEKEMSAWAKEEKFENAGIIREQLKKLNYITQSYKDPKAYLENPNLVEDIREKEKRLLFILLNKYFDMERPPERIECYDVAHTGGKNVTCSLITFINGESEKTLYRRFKIKIDKNNDFKAIKESLTRRLNHLKDWGKPDLILVDGGKPQLTAAKNALADRKENIPVIGLAKNLERVIIPQKDGFKVIKLAPQNQALKLLQRARDEAHRFARAYHFKLRLKSLLSA